MKRYGDTNTELELTDMAQRIYDVTDPLSIYEYDTEDGLRYDIKGVFEERGITADAVNSLLESMDDVIDEDGNEIDFDLATTLMDDELRESVHAELAPCTKQRFFDAYCEKHEEKYNEPFKLP